VWYCDAHSIRTEDVAIGSYSRSWERARQESPA
jgi:hypothetical protein